MVSNYSFIEFNLHLYISEVPPDDDLSRPKHVLSGAIKTFVCVVIRQGKFSLCLTK
jgi:hypothetical protein